MSTTTGRNRERSKRDEALRPLLLSGNEAIARGAWEAGAAVGAGYPGTPSTEILEALSRLGDVDCEWSPNEKVALEVAVGASLAGGRALATMKHVGVNVAADPLFSVAYMGVNGGLVLVSADDPGMHSSQNEQDNRLYARAARIPLLEPATPEEARRYTAAAFELSERCDTPVLLRTTTQLSHGRAEVARQERQAGTRRPYRKDARKNVVLPAHGRMRHDLIETRRIPQLEHEAERWVECFEGRGDVAFITAGVPFLYVREAFPDAPVLKLGMTYPLPRAAILAFAERHGRVMVIEELEPWLEEQVRALGVRVETHGLPRTGELSVPLIRAELLGERRPPAGRAPLPPLPVRPPALCPGCSHRAAFYAFNELGAIVSGDIGCYTLGATAPLDAMDACMNMGASIGMAHGMKKVMPAEEAQRVVAVIGDSTFFHSGITGLLDVVYNHGNSTVVVLDNRTTAMTGHQGHPGSGRDLNGREAPRLDIAAIARAVGVADVREIDAYDLAGAARTIDDAMRADHPSVIVARAPCVLAEKVTFGPAVHVDVAKCTECQACLRLGCPAIQVDESSRGRPWIDASLCNGCSHCQQVCANCNAGIDVPRMLELVAQERYREAFDLVLRANPFPAIAGRICPHPCEADLNALGRDQHADFAARYPQLVRDFRSPETPDRISIRLVERFLGDWAIYNLDAAGFAPRETRSASVGIVGSGPAGLAAAWYLRRHGFAVTLYDEHDGPGGMLRHGIPEFRLPRATLDAEIARLTGAGVELRCGTRLGRDTTLAQLRADHDAVVLAFGAWRGQGVRIEGADAGVTGIGSGLEYLQHYNHGDAVALGRRVAVIGGGNTAMDCARAARRAGADVTVYYRRAESEMPAIVEELDDARTEGVVIEPFTVPVRVLTRDSHVSGLVLRRTEPGAPDASGRRTPVPVAGSEFTIEVDTVMLAIGESPDLRPLESTDVPHDGRIGVRFTGATPAAGVFACGDAAFGHGTVTQAIATGRRVADAVALHLEGK